MLVSNFPQGNGSHVRRMASALKCKFGFCFSFAFAFRRALRRYPAWRSGVDIDPRRNLVCVSEQAKK